MQRLKGIAVGLTVTLATMFLMVVADAFFMLKFRLDENKIKILIYITYFISVFVGGYVTGKIAKTKKYILGMCCGGLFFLILLVTSQVLPNKEEAITVSVTLSFVICVISGCLGGMIGTQKRV